MPIILLILAMTVPTPDDQGVEERPGLVAVYVARGGRPEIREVVPDLGLDWGPGAPDCRLPVDGVGARLDGFLLIQRPGPHRFTVRTDGRATIRLGGADVESGRPVDLPPGMVPISVDYRHDRVGLSVDWSGPGFGPEPVPARLLFHAPGTPPTDPFEEGRRVADRLGCANCHDLIDLPRHPTLGPPLGPEARSIGPAWLADWLADPGRVRPGSTMPGFGLDRGEVADLIAYLRDGRDPPTPARDELTMAMNVADPAKGRLLFRSVGCLACHSSPGSGSAPIASGPTPLGPDIAGLGRKRTATAIAAALVHAPRSEVPSRHRPDLRLSPDESAHLAAYLAGDRRPDPTPAGPLGDASRGRALADRLRCDACHAIPGARREVSRSPIAGQGGCLAEGPTPGHVPRFALNDADRTALRAFIAGLPRDPSPSPPSRLADDAIRRRGCLACHARDGQGRARLGAEIARALADDPDLQALKGTLNPPDLSAVGDKLRPEYLDLAVRGRAPVARPWLSARMPAFAFEPGEAERIVGALRSHDRRPEATGPAREALSLAPAEEGRAARLIGQKGFGCVNCHVLAGKIPPGGEAETLGPDLAMAHRRMSRAYFDRWIADPQRIIPGTPMPQFVAPVATEPGSLDEQVGTLWRLLGGDRLAEVAAHGTREPLRRDGDRALIVRDMVVDARLPGSPYVPRGLAIGLKNGQSMLFDADRLAWLARWRGGFLSRTKSGRLWEWHPDAAPSWVAPRREAPVVFLASDGRVVRPGEVRERFGTFDELVFEGDGVSLSYRLNAPRPGDAPVSVRETIGPEGDGWRRRVVVSGVPSGLRPRLVETADAGGTGPPPTPLGGGLVGLEMPEVGRGDGFAKEIVSGP